MKMPRFSKIIIFLFLALSVSIGFIIYYAQKDEGDVFANNALDSQGSEESNSLLQPSVYICPKATSLEEVKPNCPEIIILDEGETRNGMTLVPTIYEGKEYYLVLGFENGGGGIGYKTEIAYQGDLSGQYSDEVNLKALLTTQDGKGVGGKTINFILGEQTITAVTDANGIATTTIQLLQIPGNYTLETKFAGEDDYLPSSESKQLEIQKENVVITVTDKEGFYDDNITLEADVKDDDGQLLLQEPKEINFKLNEQGIGTTTVDETGKAKIDWKITLIPQELTETYSIFVTFTGNEYYNSAEGQGIFTLKSAKWLKQDAIEELERAKTGDRKIDKKIDKIIWFINQSLDKNLWQDASHLVFFEKGKWKELEEILKEDEIDLNEINAKSTKMGILVFHYEKDAVRLMMVEPGKTEKLESVFEEVIKKLVKTDTLLAKVSIHDAKNTSIQNPKFKKIVEFQIKKSEEELLKAKDELEKGRPDKAISRLAKSWLHSQLAIKFASLSLKE